MGAAWTERVATWLGGSFSGRVEFANGPLVSFADSDAFMAKLP